jgi:hypothetical protein
MFTSEMLAADNMVVYITGFVNISQPVGLMIEPSLGLREHQI